jgi:hypothetical protein
LQQSIELAVPVAAEQLGADGGRKLVAYLGLDPNVRQSGEAPARTGRISKRGKCPGAPGARGSRLDRGATARAAQGVLSAHADPPRAWQGDRRDRAQARGAVLVHAHPRPGLRPPAAVADPQKKLRRLEITAGAKKYTRRAAGVWATNDTMREAELELARQAETSYRRLVQDQLAGAPARKVGASATPERA